MLVDESGLRAAVVVVEVVFLSTWRAGLDRRVLVLLAAAEDVVAFFSSSLALTLGRLRWLEVAEVAVVGRRAVVDVDGGGLVGGLLRPPVTRVLVAVVPWAVLAAVDEVTAERRAAVVAVAAPGRLGVADAVFDAPLVWAAGVSEVWDSGSLEAEDGASSGISAGTSAGGCASTSEGCATWTLSFSDMASSRQANSERQS